MNILTKISSIICVFEKEIYGIWLKKKEEMFKYN